MTYAFLQQYWWFVVSLLGALLVFLLFVQGGNSLLFCLGKTEEHKKMMVNSTGRKWEFTFTTLVTFGGAFFASFPLFYSTSFGGAYWLWMIILFSFVLQAVSYEFQSKAGNLLGKKTYRTFLVINGVVGPVLLGGAVATFFTGSEFYVNKSSMADTVMPVISHWANGWHGLDALTNLWNVVLGLAVFFLTRILGALYFINNIDDKDLVARSRRSLIGNSVLFLVFFLAFVIRTLLADGYAVNPTTGEIFMEPYKYLTNFIEMPLVNVFLGLIGTFWFRTRRRRGEIALRLAMGSTKSQVFRLLTGEGLLLLALVTLPAMIICYNIGVAEFTIGRTELISTWPVKWTFIRFLLGSLGAWLLIALMVMVGIWFPARQAMKIQPAEALHEE